MLLPFNSFMAEMNQVKIINSPLKILDLNILIKY